MIPTEIITLGLRMERSNLRLGLIISLIIMANSVIILSSTNSTGIYVVTSIAFVFALISEYLLARQILDGSRVNVSILNQLGARHRSITIAILFRFLLFGSIGIIVGLILGIAASVALHTTSLSFGLQGLLTQQFINHILIVGLAGIGGIIIGSYLGIISSLEINNRYSRP